MLADVTPILACPHCGAALTGPVPAGTSPTRTGTAPPGAAATGRNAAVRCGDGHTFDVARQGYVTLLPGGERPGGDTPGMVGARAAFLATGHFDSFAGHLAEWAADSVAGGNKAGFVIDAGAGTGFYLSAVLGALPRYCGLALDLSKHAARRAARAHRRIGAVVADTWRPWPVRPGAAGLVLNVFAPRNAAQMHRALAPGAAAAVVTPAASHLRELVASLGLLTVDRAKQHRLGRAMAPYFRLAERHEYRQELSLSREDARLLAGMGPSAWHQDEAGLRERCRSLPEPVTVTVTLAVEFSLYARVDSLPVVARPDPGGPPPRNGQYVNENPAPQSLLTLYRT